MPRTDEAAAFFHAVYSAVSEIPPGRVTSYGHIAALIGTPQRPRQVGVCLKHLPDDTDADADADTESEPSRRQRWNHSNVPWQRVVNARGVISPRGGRPGATRAQADLLRAEGVQVTGVGGGLGELSVDLDRYGWFPSALPSEGVKEEEEEEEEEEEAEAEEEEPEHDEAGVDDQEVKEQEEEHDAYIKQEEDSNNEQSNR
ncbi:hypothetical protein V2A60_002596 [Cordyceps javanica]|uniref:6-O-methylguanine DNA methyltransferase n=1 Tax=Cordyceps javanica TaxID=43265 RepID=A0A545UY26_9HYPO|nr:6-O-methylguanine DNA methyltransferase [Cordyceps javanica]TQW06242.1 6-O-methylguanine DNA methyltransferase [Cordyceps javanica]